MEIKDLKKGKKYYHTKLKLWVKFVGVTQSLWGNILYGFTYKIGKKMKLTVLEKNDLNILLTHKDIYYNETDYR